MQGEMVGLSVSFPFPSPGMIHPLRRLEMGGATVKVFANSGLACDSVVEHLRYDTFIIAEHRGKAVLGLATGATPEPVYARMVELVHAGSYSFWSVHTYNLDEYYPMSPLDPRSYRSYMNRHLFDHIKLAPNHTHLLDGTVPEAFAAAHAAEFDRWIAADGGIDIQLLGLGRNGHIGFNEPSNLPVAEAIKLPTRLVDLHPTTIADAAKDFGGEDKVPRQALTMGLATILAARQIIILAFGQRKAQAVARSLQGPITAEVPGSLLQTVPGRVFWYIDQAAASEIL
jgi:glucosamine-6-phosphate deaminase